MPGEKANNFCDSHTRAPVQLASVVCNSIFVITLGLTVCTYIIILLQGISGCSVVYAHSCLVSSVLLAVHLMIVQQVQTQPLVAAGMYVTIQTQLSNYYIHHMLFSK